MSTRWEFANAKRTGTSLWNWQEVYEETDEKLDDDQVALVLSYDEAFVLTGTLVELEAFAERIRDLVVAERKRQLPELVPPADAEDGDDVEATCQYVWTAEDVEAMRKSDEAYVARMVKLHGAEAHISVRYTYPEVGTVCGSYLLLWELEPMYRVPTWRGGHLRAGDSKFGDAGEDDTLVCSNHQHEWAFPDEIDYV